MIERLPRLVAALVVGMLFALGAAAVSPSPAGWLDRIGRLADDAGRAGSALRHGVPGDEFAGAFARHMRSLPAEASTGALAAHATPEGHWRFANRSGEEFTAANAAEMERVAATLLPDTPAGTRLSLYLDEETMFRRPDLVEALPENTELHLLADGRAFRLDRLPGAGFRFTAEVRPNVRVELSEARLFEEAVWQLGRPLNRSNIRVVSLEPGARQTLPSAPRVEPATNAAMVDQIDPWKLPAALSSVQGQTVVLTGRIEGDLLHFKPPGGAEKALRMSELTEAAHAADVNLVVLQSERALQPGARNWLWQKVEVKGLGDALDRGNLGDFLDALGAGHRGLRVAVSDAPTGRARLDIVPAEPASPVTGGLGNWADDLVSGALGKLVIEAIKLDAVAKERREELDRRIVPGVPSALQWLYLAGMVLGLIGFGYSRRWFARIWPPEERSDYAGAVGYHAARGVRGLAFLLVFLPLAGLPAGVWAMLVGTLQQLWSLVTAPFRTVRWLARKLGFASG